MADGSVATYQTLPWNYCAWHSGGDANNTHLSFEICEDGLTDANYFNKVYQEAVELCAYLCKMYNLDPMKDGVLICHSEGNKRGIASNHADVLHWFPKHDKNMDTFRADVNRLLDSDNLTAPVEHLPFQSYTVRVTVDELNIRKDAGTNTSIVGVIKDKGVYTIVEESSGVGAADLNPVLGGLVLTMCRNCKQDNP